MRGPSPGPREESARARWRRTLNGLHIWQKLLCRAPSSRCSSRFRPRSTFARSPPRRSADSAKEIKTLIAESVQAASLGAKRVDETGRAMDDIMDSVRRVADIFGEVNAASHEQRNGIEQVNKAVTQMDRTTQENAALVGEVAASSQALLDQAQRLGEVVCRFHLARDAAPEPLAAPAPASDRPTPLAPARKHDVPRLTAAE
jgi:hypothetical protein